MHLTWQPSHGDSRIGPIADRGDIPTLSILYHSRSHVKSHVSIISLSFVVIVVAFGALWEAILTGIIRSDDRIHQFWISNPWW